MAKQQASTTTKMGTLKNPLRDRFCVAVQFLLNCYDTMHHLKMAKVICFVLKDVEIFLLGVDSSSRMEIFSDIISVTMDELGFLKKKVSAILDLTVVTKDELLLLFVVCYLSLNGKSHFEKVVEDLVDRAPQVISMILSGVSVPGKLGYLWKYPQCFSVDALGFMELPSTFSLTFKESPDDSEAASSEAGGTNESPVDIFSCETDGYCSDEVGNDTVGKGNVEESDIPLLENNSTSSTSNFFNLRENWNSKKCMEVENLPLPLNIETLSKFDCTFLKDNSPVLVESNTSNKIFSHDVRFQNDTQTNQSQKMPTEAELFSSLKLKKHIEKPRSLTPTSQLDEFCSFLSGVSKSSNVTSVVNNEYQLLEISTEEKSSSGIALNKDIPNKEIENNITSISNKDFSANVRNFLLSEGKDEVSKYSDEFLANNVSCLERDRVCSMVREGIVFLFELFKCQIDLHLVSVVLHALHEAKRLFLWLPQPEQIALVEKILEPLWVAGVEDSSGSLLRPSSDQFDLNKEHQKLLFISYAVSESEKLHYSKLLEMFEKYKIDITDIKKIDGYLISKKDFVCIDEAEYITFENFPPAKWMADLSSETVFPPDSFSVSAVQSKTSKIANDMETPFKDLSLDQTGVSKTVPTNKNTVREEDTKKSTEDNIEGISTNNGSGYSQDMLDYLIAKVQNSIAYLLKFFDLNVYSRFLEVVLHVSRDCSLFFSLPLEQQLAVIRASFRAFHIDRQGRVTCNSATKQPEFKLTDSQMMLLCISYILNQKNLVHYQHVFGVYHQCIGKTKHLKDSDQLEYFKKRSDIFFAPGDVYFGLVRLANVQTIKFDYVSILMSDRNSSPVVFNPRSGMPRPIIHGPIILNPDAVGARMNYSPPIFTTNAFVPRMTCNPIAVNTGVVMPGMNFPPVVYNTGMALPRMNNSPMVLNTAALRPPPVNCSPMVLNTGALVHQTNCSPMVFNNGTLGPQMNYVPAVYSVGSLGPQTKYNPTVLNASVLRPPPNFNPIILNQTLLRPNFNPLVLNPIALRPQMKCSSSNSCVENIGNKIPVGPNTVNSAKDKTVFGGNSLAVVDSLERKENVSVVQLLNDGVRSLNITDEEKEMRRVIGSIIFLSQSFSLEADDLTLVFFILEDVQSHLLELNLQAQEDFVEKCVKHLLSSYSDSISLAAAKLDLCTLNDEEKTVLFIALLLSREKEMHFTHVFDKFYKCNASMLPSRKSVLDQQNFVTKWNHVFSLSPNGNVKLLQVLLKNSEVSASDNNVPCVMNQTNSLTDRNNDFENKYKSKSKDSIKHFLEKNSTSQNNSFSIKSNYFKSALRFYNRIKDSIMFLSETFEGVSVEQITKTIFYVLHDIHDLFCKVLDVNISVLEVLHLSFSERKPTQVQEDNLICELSTLNQEEKNLLALICILIQSSTMHYQELFNVFESHGGKKLTTSAEQYTFLEKKRNYFTIDIKGNVNLKEKQALKSYLEDFFKDVNLKLSFQSALLEGSDKNAFTLVEGRRKKCKSSSGSIQHDVLRGIQDICNDVLSLSQQKRCNSKSLHKESSKPGLDVQSTIKTEDTISISASKSKKELNSIILKQSSVALSCIHPNGSGSDEHCDKSIARNSTPVFNILETKECTENIKSTAETELNNSILIGSPVPSLYVHPNSRGSVEHCDKTFTGNSATIFNLLETELGTEDTISIGAAKSETKLNSSILINSPVFSRSIHPNSIGSDENCDKTITKNTVFNLLEAELGTENTKLSSNILLDSTAAPPRIRPNSFESSEHSDKTITKNSTPIFNLLETEFGTENTTSTAAAKSKTDLSSNILTDFYLDHPNSSVFPEQSDKTFTRNTKPIFNLLETLSDDESNEVVSWKTSESIAYPSFVSDCGCVKDSTKELRAKNFFRIMLSQSRTGFSLPVLAEKLMFASKELQHYMSCVYKNNILNFLQNHVEFHISPTSGNVYCKASK